MGAERRGIHSTDNGRTGRGADRGCRYRVRIEQGVFGEGVEVRCRGVLVPVATKVWAMIFGGEPENVRAVRSRQGGEYSETGKEKEGEAVTRHGEERRGRPWRFHNRYCE